MPVFYLETSALFKRYRSETGADLIHGRFEGRTGNDVLVTSQLSLLEVNTVAARLLKGRLLRRKQYDELVGTFLADLAAFDVTVLPLGESLVSEALAILPDYPLRAADALHFASALTVARAVGAVNLVFASSDQELCAVCSAFDIRCLDPASPSATDQLRALR